jgi:hypothetical protein
MTAAQVQSTASTPSTAPTGGKGAVAPIVTFPGGTIDTKRFEGAEVHGSVVSISGTTRMPARPVSGNAEDEVFTIDDIITVQLDLKINKIYHEAGKDGQLMRVQLASPVSSTEAIVVDVVRRDPTMRIK